MLKKHGFTLIELLVVIVIIGIITATTLFSIGDGGQKRRMEAAVTKLQSALQLAQTQAILTNSVIGFQVKKNSYAFYLFSTAPDRESARLNIEWVPIKNSTTLARQNMSGGITLALSVSNNLFNKIQNYRNGNSDDQPPQVLILPSGGFTPFILVLTNNSKKNHSILQGDMAGNLSLSVVQSK